MWVRALLCRATPPLFFAPSPHRRDRARLLLGRVGWSLQQAALAAHLTWTLLTLPFFWCRAHIHRLVFGGYNTSADVVLTIGMGKVCLKLWADRETERWARPGRQPLEEAWPALVAADQAPAPAPLGPNASLVTAATGHNMLVYRVSNSKGGGVLLHNAVFLDDDKMKALEALGPVRGVICPSVSSLPRCLQLGQRVGAPVFMPRLQTVIAAERIADWKKDWQRPVVAEEFPMEGTFGVRVHEPSGTKGHQHDGQRWPAENFYEFPQTDGTSILACGTILSDRDHKWAPLPSYETKGDRVTIPTRVLKEGLSNAAALEAFLGRMAARHPTCVIPAVGAIVSDAPRTLEGAAADVRAWATRPRWLW